MQTTNKVIDYYKQGFIDPLYAPYEKVGVDIGNGCTYQVYKSTKMGGSCFEGRKRGDPPLAVGPDGQITPTPLINPEEIRIGRGHTFQKQNAYTTACPPGFDNYPGGYCVKSAPTFDPIMYTTDNYSPVDYFPQRFSPQIKDTRPIKYPQSGIAYGWGGNPSVKQSKYTLAGAPECYIYST